MVGLEDLLVEELVGGHAEELVLFKTPVHAVQAYSVWIGAPSAPECPSAPCGSDPANPGCSCHPIAPRTPSSGDLAGGY